MSQSTNIHITGEVDPEKMAAAFRKTKPRARGLDAKRIASAIVDLTGCALMCLAAYHFAGWWGVVAVNGFVLGPLSPQSVRK